MSVGRSHILVPGKFLQDRISSSASLNFSVNEVHSVGWPRLDSLIEAKSFTSQSKSLFSNFKSYQRKLVLWAPTHNQVKSKGSNVEFSSYPAFKPYFSRLGKIFKTRAALHPRNKPFWDKRPTGNILVEADAVIADFGTTVWEAFALGKTVIFPTFLTGERMENFNVGSAEWHLYTQRLGLHPESFDEMVDMIIANPPMDEKTRSFVDPTFPK
jgi:hypothetical protein